VNESIVSAFMDELTKIAAGGFTRTGIRPRMASTVLKNSERFVKRKFDVPAAKNLFKGAGVNARHVGAAALSGGALALVGERKLKKMHEDWRMGREIRRQQGG